MKNNADTTSTNRGRRKTKTATPGGGGRRSAKLHILRKALERNCLTFLGTRWGMTLTVVMSFITLDVLLYGVQMSLITYSQNRPAALSEVRDILAKDVGRKVTHSPTDNIAHKSFMDILLPEPIDIVYTWVNGSDPEHAAALKRFKESREAAVITNNNNNNNTLSNDTAVSAGNNTNTTAEQGPRSDEMSASRFQDNDELIFSLRSVEKYAPWVRRIWLVTNGQVPSWLDLSNPHITVVTHQEIFPNASHLPTFSSPAIEAHLHRIPGLSSRFIYLNDDVMFGAPVWPDDFHTVSGGQKIFFAWPVPNCAEGCLTNWLGDGFCDQACNVSECDYDNGDCLGNNSQNNGFGTYGNNNAFAAELGHKDKYCTKACPDSWLGDKFCDKACQVPECGYDMSDCGAEMVYNGIPGYVPVNGGIYVPPNDTLAVYFNYSSLFADLVQPVALQDGDFGSTEIVRTAVISIKSQILVVAFNRNVTLNATNITLNVSDALGAFHNLSFTLVIDTTKYDAAIREKMERLERAEMERRASASTSGNETLYNATESPANATINATVNATANVTANATGNASSSSSSSPTPQPPKSNKIDTFGESLKYVNRLYSRKYGSEARKVPAHMPHFIDTRIMRELQAEFPAQFEETSSHQLRSERDMQYSFSYMYYIIDRPEEFDLARIWYEYFDTNGSGDLDENELWTLLVYIWGGSPNAAQYNETMGQLNNCTKDAWPITLADFEKCNATVTKLRTAMKKRKLYRHEEYDTTTVGFIMVGNNDTTLQGKLDGIRLNRHKFICLNDNLNHSDPDSQEVLKMLRDFYVSMYPNRSSFELPPGVTNPYLHVDEIRTAEQVRRVALARKVSLVISLAFAAFIAIGCLSIKPVKI